MWCFYFLKLLEIITFAMFLWPKKTPPNTTITLFVLQRVDPALIWFFFAVNFVLTQWRAVDLSKQESKLFHSSASLAAFSCLQQKQKVPIRPLCFPTDLSLSLTLFDRRPIQECAPTFTIGTLWLAHRLNTAGCGHISSVRTHRRTWMAGSGPWTRLRWCSRVTLWRGWSQL